MNRLKRKFEMIICSHNWEIWTVSMTNVKCKCKKCDAVRKAKLKWGGIIDIYKPIKW